MGRKKGWFSSIKRALTRDFREKKKSEKSKKKWLGKEGGELEVAETPDPVPIEMPPPSNVPPPLEEEKLLEQQPNHDDHSAEIVAAVDAEAAQPPVAAHVVSHFTGKSNEEVAAIRIQTAFRGYMARRALRALRGLVRLKTLADGATVRRQVSSTLKYMQSLSRVQSQIQSRRLRMLEENRAFQRQQLQKRAQELESLKMGEEWDDSVQSKERVEENLLHKFEATMRRERALAYSYTHQQTWKKSTRPTSLLFMDPTNPQWGWSWVERQTVAPNAGKNVGVVEEIAKSFARYKQNSEKKKHEDGTRRHTIGGGSSMVREEEESLASSSPVFPSYMAPTHSAKAKLKLVSETDAAAGGGGLAKKRLSFSQQSSSSSSRKQLLSGHRKAGSAESFALNDDALSAAAAAN